MLRLKAALANAATRVKMEVRIVAEDRVVADKDVRSWSCVRQQFVFDRDATTQKNEETVQKSCAFGFGDKCRDMDEAIADRPQWVSTSKACAQGYPPLSSDGRPVGIGHHKRLHQSHGATIWNRSRVLWKIDTSEIGRSYICACRGFTSCQESYG